MWIVSQFVESLGGTVWVEPRAGGGLIVRARFPLQAGQPLGGQPIGGQPLGDQPLGDQREADPGRSDPNGPALAPVTNDRHVRTGLD